MPVAWYLAPYKRRRGDPLAIPPVPEPSAPTRYCSVDDFTSNIVADGGSWSESECLGDYAVVKISASQVTLDAVAAAPGVRRVPLSILDNSLASLTLAQRQAIRVFIGNLGYSQAEIQNRFGSGTDLAGFTLRDVLRFVLTRRLRPRYDVGTDTIFADGVIQSCRDLDLVNADVTVVVS